MTDICKQCGGEYKRIATHWNKNDSCSHPSLTTRQKEVATGLLMGDGSVNRLDGRNPNLRSNMISRAYLEYVDDVFSIFGNGVTLYKTAEENAKEKRNTGFSEGAKAKNYSDIYSWHSMRHPDFQEFENWYGSGEKVWPNDIKLTPVVLKHWYCGDGYYHNKGSNNHIEFGVSNERENTEKIDGLFEGAGLPSPNNYRTYTYNSGHINCVAEFGVEESKELFEYMGEPLPDFGYKWPEEYR